MTEQTQLVDVKQWIKTRSSLDSNQSNFLTWTGNIYSFIPGEKRKLLFKMVGMSVSRCIQNTERSWDFTSRELTYYLNPETKEILHKWQNPWNQEILTVMHVANSPVQGKFKDKLPVELEGEKTNFVFDIFPNYVNPLAENSKFTDYCPGKIYQAAELFKISVATADLENPELNSVTELSLSWDRIGPWLPWMKMGESPGYLIYSAIGKKVSGLQALHPILQQEINNRVPLYKEAPKTYIEGEDMTSWLYFQKHFSAYLAGEIFPIPTPEAV
ncbi:DUF1838 domain-containing protein [Dolichospermum sp. FACHB-1091]|uniref:DUF1838 domain-containing protein n=1 Tax=Dolichospermum sp. FACHB-1091 TaxID=2692798 RepID=UPI0016813239|nr:DUF1838 domain-containing protein [Dolichospermum sp. FACHB-1091]MBD2444652.1 DUF1838 domain-containing protein [Dolichospermum sp. FACHB-1091]